MSNIKEITVPDIGDFNDIPVIEIPVSVGDQVTVGDTLLVLESDKSTVEVPAEATGTVIHIAVAVDDKVSQGSLMMTIDVSLAAESSIQLAATGSAAGLPDADNKKAAEAMANQIQPAAVQTTSHKSPAGPVATAPGIEQIENNAREPIQPSPAPRQADSNTHRRAAIYASPSIRRYARQLGAPLEQIQGTAAKQRVTREDIECYVKTRLTQQNTGNNVKTGGLWAELPDWPQINFEQYGPTQRQPLSRIAKISGPALARNAMVIPHVTHFDETDITELEAFRKKLNAEATSEQAKITLLTFAVKAVIAALKAYPIINSSLDGEELVIKQYWNIGIAVDTPGGLLVPVIKAADQKGCRDISNEMAALANDARQGSQMQGATFTISSLGSIGGTNFTPIINAPEVAILGLARSQMQPVWDGQAFTPRLIQPLSLSFDHRVIDGVASARFVSHIAASLHDLRRINL